jgi:hypothetical protein
MCRSIKVLRRPAEPVTTDDISAAALQFVRKVSGYHKPSKMNQAAFDTAVNEIATTTERLLQSLSRAQPAGRSPERPLDSSPRSTLAN